MGVQLAAHDFPYQVLREGENICIDRVAFGRLVHGWIPCEIPLDPSIVTLWNQYTIENCPANHSLAPGELCKLATPDKSLRLRHSSAMSQRILYLAAYDVADPRRLRQALQAVKTYATGGQKSVYECFLTGAERDALLTEIRGTLDDSEDRFMLVRMDPRSRVSTLGIAVKPADPEFFYVG